MNKQFEKIRTYINLLDVERLVRKNFEKNYIKIFNKQLYLTISIIYVDKQFD